MKYSECPLEATCKCQCGPQMFCNQHLLDHIDQPGEHRRIKVENIYDQKSCNEVKNEMNSRLTAIEIFERQLSVNTMRLCRQVRLFYMKAYSKLDKKKL
jgi:hypothetical protein